MKNPRLIQKANQLSLLLVDIFFGMGDEGDNAPIP